VVWSSPGIVEGLDPEGVGLFEAFVARYRVTTMWSYEGKLEVVFLEIGPLGETPGHVGWLHDHLHHQKRKVSFPMIARRRKDTEALGVPLGIYH